MKIVQIVLSLACMHKDKIFNYVITQFFLRRNAAQRMNQGCLLKEAVASRTLALIAGKHSNLSRGLQESKALSPGYLKAPQKN